MSNWDNPGDRPDGPNGSGASPQGPNEQYAGYPGHGGHPGYGGTGGYGSAQPPGQGYPQPGHPPYSGYPQQGYPQPPAFVPQPPPPAAKPGTLSLRPQSVSDVLDVAFQTIKANPTASFGVSVLCGLVGLALGTILVASGGGVLLASDSGHEGVGVAFFIALVVAIPLIMLLNLVSTGALIHVFSQAVLGNRATVGEALRTGFRRVWSALGMALLTGMAFVLVWTLVVIFIAVLAAAHTNTAVLVLLIVLAVFGGLAMGLFAVRFVFAFHVVVMEEAGPITALRRAFRLTRRRFWRTFGILLLAYLVLSVVSSVLQFAAQMLSTGILGASGGFHSDGSGQSHPSVGTVIGIFLIMGVLSLLVSAFTQPFMVNVIGGLYVDARIRDEGLAGALLAASGQNVDPGSTAPMGPPQAYGGQPYGGPPYGG